MYRYREGLAVLPSAVLALLLAGGLRDAKPLKPKYDDPVKLDLIEPPPPLPQAAPQPQPKPEPMPPAKTAPRPQLRSAPQPRATTPTAPGDVPPTAVERSASPGEAMSAPAPARTTPAAAPATSSAPPAPAAPKVDAEAEFIGKVRTYLNSVKRYPIGREAGLQRPEGNVKVWFVLRRDGSVVDAGIEESSDSPLLDQAARKSIHLGRFPAFPEQFRPGQAQHRFVVDLQFKPGAG